MVEWEDVLAVVAVSRGAAPPRIMPWVKHGFATENCIRLRMRLLRGLASLPTVLSVVAAALALWRGVMRRGAMCAFGRVPCSFGDQVLMKVPDACADVALYHGTFLAPLSVGKVANAILAQALARSPHLAAQAEFHFLCAAMLTVAHELD